MYDVFGGDMMEFLKGLAPTLASALLGPLGGVAVSAIGNILGVSDATTTTITKAFQDGKLTPEQLSSIKQLELQYQNDEKERGFKYADLEFKDVADARDMQKITRSNIPAILAVFVTTGFFGILTFMLTTSYKPTEPLLVMLGSLGTAWSGIVAFYFGSSHGSQQKDVLLANSQPTNVAGV
jgi:hypothetical protein